MKNRFILKSAPTTNRPANIFANRSGLILHELLMHPTREFQVRDLARHLNLSHGLVQRVTSQLVRQGIVTAEGLRTAKRYQLAKPNWLLRRWVDEYDISLKCRFHNYSSGYTANEIAVKLKKIKLLRDTQIALALHSSARAHNCGFTNLQTTELYCGSKENREKLEVDLRLQPRDRGYDVLLIEPYYGSIVTERSEIVDGLPVSSPLLTFLDLYHFPLRGNEQAEHLMRKHPALRGLAAAFKGD